MSSTRRQFVTLATLGTCALCLPQTTLAADRVSESDSNAQALNYVHDATQSDKRSDMSQTCENCQLYAKVEGEDWAPCALFQNKLVAGKGWCSAWVARAG